ILSETGSVVADAVFDRPSDRARIEKVAAERGVPFQGVWLAAGPDVLWQRVKHRSGGPSDATVDVLSQQLQRHPGMVNWHRLDAARYPEEIVSEILALPPAGIKSVRSS
ncbi:MAG: AAA family ATPase, partial [Pseudaminobacter sp.]